MSWKDRLKQVADQGKQLADQGKQKIAEQQSKRNEQWANDPNTLWFGESQNAATSAAGVSKARYRITRDRVWIESGLLGTRTESVPAVVDPRHGHPAGRVAAQQGHRRRRPQPR